MSDQFSSTGKLVGDTPAAANPGVLVDRKELAFIAVERTRMPMVISDARLPDNPIVLANAAFLQMTGYEPDEIIGRNCRFLQGPETDPAAVDRIRQAVADAHETTVEILNYRRDGSQFWNQLHISPIHDDTGEIIYFFASQVDVSERRRVEELEAAEHGLLREVDHRAKNALALVQGIVRLSRSDDPVAYAQAVQGRVDALAMAHLILSEQRWRHVPIDRLIKATVNGIESHRLALQGGEFGIAAGQVQPLALVLHEMIGNAAKHGSLSGDAGRIDIDWRRSASSYQIDITESGGPAPTETRNRGFGSTIIEAVVKRQLGGTVDFDWQPAGLRSHLSIPAADLVAA